MFIPFNKISENYTCWVYQTEKMITQKEKVFISKSLESFCEKWTSHNNSVKSSYVINFDSFIILFADQNINKKWLRNRRAIKSYKTNRKLFKN